MTDISFSFNGRKNILYGKIKSIDETSKSFAFACN